MNTRYRVHVVYPSGTIKHEIVELTSPNAEIAQLERLAGGPLEMINQTFEYEGCIRRTNYVNEDRDYGDEFNQKATDLVNYPIFGNLVIVMGAEQ